MLNASFSLEKVREDRDRAYLHRTICHGHVIGLSPSVRMATQRLPFAILPRDWIVRIVDQMLWSHATIHEQTICATRKFQLTKTTERNIKYN